MAIAPKKDLRKRLLTQRQSLTLSDWQLKSERLCQHLTVFPNLINAHTLCAYRSFRQEPNLDKLWEVFPTKRWGFSRCEGKSLIWHQWSAREKLPFQLNRFRIEEPNPDWPQIDAAQVEVILVPTVACDRDGYRLGYGGGFYDRLFQHPDWHKAMKIGIVFHDFIFEKLPRDTWDIPLDAIASEQGIIQIIKSSDN